LQKFIFIHPGTGWIIGTVTVYWCESRDGTLDTFPNCWGTDTRNSLWRGFILVWPVCSKTL